MSDDRKDRLKKLLETPVDRPFPEIHKEIEGIMGRPVYTHELAAGVCQYLYDELDGKPVPGPLTKMFLIRGEDKQ